LESYVNFVYKSNGNMVRTHAYAQVVKLFLGV
jgi:hypothetical protein